MKFREYLVENNKEFESFLDLIRKDCKTFVNDSRRPIFRGISGVKFKKILNKNDREPRDSKVDYLFNNLFNIALEKISGVNYIRKKSIFCTSDYSQAAYYGGVGYVFPVDNVKYIYGTTVYDSFEDINPKNIIKEIKRIKFYGNINNDNMIRIEHYLDAKKDVDSDALLSWTSSIGNHDKDAKLFVDKLTNYFESEYGYKKTDDIKQVEKDRVRTTGEILLYDIPFYYVINVTFVEKYLQMKDNNDAKFIVDVYYQLLKTINEG